MDKLYTGCVPDPIDERDYHYGLGAIAPMTDEEWTTGYRVDQALGLTIPIKDQKQSYSCVGQGVAYYTGVLNFVETGVYTEVSAKAIYSQVSLGQNQGAYIRDGIKLIVDWGAVYENLVRCYKNDGSVDETFMRDKSWITPEMIETAKMLQSKEYQLVDGFDMDTFARAIKEGHGVVSGVTGTNNGSWTTLTPTPPTLDTPQNKLWGHCLFFGGYGKDARGKFIWVLNSWGTFGWQKLYEEWFGDDGRWMYNPWVLIDKNNNNFMFKKEVGKPHIYLIDETKKTKTMLVDMKTLEAFNQSYTEVPSLAEYADAGTLVYVERIIN
jgi:hypothetical protein